MPSLLVLPNKELEELTTRLEKERAARKSIADEEAALEDELESLSQALFEEANKMVATEHMKRAETEELQELCLEKEALRSALRLVEGEYSHLRSSGSNTDIPSTIFPPSSSVPGTEMQHSSESSHSRSSSTVALKSRPSTPILLEEMLSTSPPSLVVELDLDNTLPLPSSGPLEEQSLTPKYTQTQLTSLLPEPSSWQNASSNSPSTESYLTLLIGTTQ